MRALAKVTDKKIVGLTVKYSVGTSTSYNLAKPLPEKSKTELRELITELRKLVKDKGVRVVIGKTNYDKNHTINP